jgi:hypothetical protein
MLPIIGDYMQLLTVISIIQLAKFSQTVPLTIHIGKIIMQKFFFRFLVRQKLKGSHNAVSDGVANQITRLRLCR